MLTTETLLPLLATETRLLRVIVAGYQVYCVTHLAAMPVTAVHARAELARQAETAADILERLAQ